MSTQSFSERLPQNVPAKFYVDEQCLDCGLCREIIPAVFFSDETMGAAFVGRQPESSEELLLTLEAVAGCPCQAIFADGDEHDWAIPRTETFPPWLTGDAEKPTCPHCNLEKTEQRPWWKFW